GDGDGDASRLLLRGRVDRIEGAELGLALQGQDLGDRGRERRLAVVDVTDGADVHVRLGALELLLGHVSLQLLLQSPPSLREPSTGIEPVTSSLPRTCSTD